MPPYRLLKLWLLGYLFNITSERRHCEEAGLNLAWRWFLGYELDKPVPGPDHLDTADSLNYLALLPQAQGELAAARPLFERALAIRERVLGPDHPLTVSVKDA